MFPSMCVMYVCMCVVPRNRLSLHPSERCSTAIRCIFAFDMLTWYKKTRMRISGALHDSFEYWNLVCVECLDHMHAGVHAASALYLVAEISFSLELTNVLQVDTRQIQYLVPEWFLWATAETVTVALTASTLKFPKLQTCAFACVLMRVCAHAGINALEWHSQRVDLRILCD